MLAEVGTHQTGYLWHRLLCRNGTLWHRVAHVGHARVTFLDEHSMYMRVIIFEFILELREHLTAVNAPAIEARTLSTPILYGFQNKYTKIEVEV